MFEKEIKAYELVREEYQQKIADRMCQRASGVSLKKNA